MLGLLEAEIPEVMYTAETENFVRDYDNRLRMQGLDLNTYFKYTGQTLDDLRTQMRPQAEKQVKMRLALEAIAKIENITATDAEIDEEYKRIADSYGMEADKVKELIAKEDINADLSVKKAFDVVKENAVITKKSAKKAADAEVAEEKPATKKTTKKSTDTEAKPATKKTTTKKTAAKADGDAEKAPAKKTTSKKSTAKKAEDK